MNNSKNYIALALLLGLLGGYLLSTGSSGNSAASFGIRRAILTVTRAGNGSGTVFSSDGRINCGRVCSLTDNYLSNISLSAKPSAGSTFTGWSGGSYFCKGTDGCRATLLGNQNIVATFSKPYTLRVASAGSGSGHVWSSGSISPVINCDLPSVTSSSSCAGEVAPGANVTLMAAPAGDGSSVFTGWSGGNCYGAGTCVPPSVYSTTTLTLAARFAKLFTLSVATNGTGNGSVVGAAIGTQFGQINCGTKCSLTIPDPKENVTLRATPANSNSVFSGWDGDCKNVKSTQCVFVWSGGNKSVMATFSGKPTITLPQSYSLSVTKSGDGLGAVTSSPVGINCGAICSASYNSGTVVTLSAASSVSSTFTGWGGACSGTGSCVVTMNAARNVTAAFGLLSVAPPAAPLYKLTVSTQDTHNGFPGAGTGNVASDDSVSPAINCGGSSAACSGSVPSGAAVKLTAVAGNHSLFDYWNGGPCLGSNKPVCSFIMPGNDVEATAGFFYNSSY